MSDFNIQHMIVLVAWNCQYTISYIQSETDIFKGMSD